MKKPKVIVGIDPGKSGGIALIQGKDVTLWKLTNKNQQSICSFIAMATDPDEVEAYAGIEWINPGMFGVHKSAAAKLYGSFTELRMVLVAYDIPFEDVKKWHRDLNIPPRKKGEKTPQWKTRLFNKAREMFPKVRGLTRATCDALLIAECVRRRKGW